MMQICSICFGYKIQLAAGFACWLNSQCNTSSADLKTSASKQCSVRNDQKQAVQMFCHCTLIALFFALSLNIRITIYVLFVHSLLYVFMYRTHFVLFSFWRCCSLKFQQATTTKRHKLLCSACSWLKLVETALRTLSTSASLSTSQSQWLSSPK